jgi:hypothetical protein
MGIVFEHLYSVQDESMSADSPDPLLRCGITEWQGAFGGAVVSLAWDWALRPDGQVFQLRAVQPRTNLKLIDAKGYDVRDALEAPVFWARVEALDWTRMVLEALDPRTAAFRH